MRCTQGELCERGVLLVLGQLGIELQFFFRQLALFLQAAYQLLLREIAFVLALIREFPGFLQFLLRRFQPRARDEGSGNEHKTSEPKSRQETGARQLEWLSAGGGGQQRVDAQKHQPWHSGNRQRAAVRSVMRGSMPFLWRKPTEHCALPLDLRASQPEEQ